MGNFKFSQRSLERMEGVHPDLVLIFKEAILISPIDFGIPEYGGVRPDDIQNILFKDGKSKCDGYKIKSKHQLKDGEEHGMALDFYAYIDGGASWKWHHLSMVAGVIMITAKRLKQEGLITHDILWGGTFGSSCFSGWDMPHVELVKL